MHSENCNADGTGMQYYESPSFEEASSNNNMSSPTPIVEKGGENEFVKVSHLASVQVKAVPAQSVPKNKTEKPEHSNRVRGKAHKMPEHQATLPLRSNPRRLRGSSSKRINSDDDIDSFVVEENTSNLETIDVIEKSPYEPGKSAENGESLFEEMKALLLEDDDEDNAHAVQIFGTTNAGCLVKVNSLIEKSGMLYSQNWNKGSIHGVPVGIIPNHLLLMVLVPNRFAKASELLLSGLCRDLEVYESVNRGLDDWGWSEDYTLVRATRKNYKFKTNKRDCFKCAVFVARAHSCFLSFGKKKLDRRLRKKLKACLNLMEENLVTPVSTNCHKSQTASNNITAGTCSSLGTALSNGKKRKKTTPDNVLSTSSSTSYTTTCTAALNLPITKNSIQLSDLPLKRKRGRPPKSTKHQPIRQISSIQQLCAERDSVDEGNEPVSSRPKRSHFQSKEMRGGSRIDGSASPLMSRQVSSSRSIPSLHQLISRFEAQYEEMGQRYAEMGTLLAEMKNAIDDRRTQSEQEIRRELLDEIQRNILESMPKR